MLGALSACAVSSIAAIATTLAQNLRRANHHVDGLTSAYGHSEI
jgi:hypothetical protein